MIEYKFNNVPISIYGAMASPMNGYYGLSGLLDLPKRIGQTEYSWGTGIEPFVDDEDIQLDGRKLMLTVAVKKVNLDAFINACLDCTTLSTDFASYDVICKDEIKVTAVTSDYMVVEIPFWEQVYELDELSLSPSDIGNYRVDNYGLGDDFNIYVTKGSQGLYSIAKRIEVTTTEFYEQAEYRSTRAVTIECAMMADDLSELNAKMKQLHSLIMSPGLRKIKLNDDIFEAYFKDGIAVTVPRKDVAFFKLNAIVI